MLEDLESVETELDVCKLCSYNAPIVCLDWLYSRKVLHRSDLQRHIDCDLHFQLTFPDLKNNDFDFENGDIKSCLFKKSSIVLFGSCGEFEFHF